MANLSRIVSVVQIKDVRLYEGTCRSFVRPSESAENVVVQQSHAHSILKSKTDELLIRVRFKLGVHEEGDEKKRQVEIRATYELSYRVPSKKEFSDEEVDEFGRVNAVFNAWPYWREYVQGSLARMLMPSYTIPVFRVRRGDAPPGQNGKPPKKRRSPSPKR